MPTLLLKILFIDDNPHDIELNVELMRDVQNFNFEYKAASTLSEALAHIETTRFDVVILDLNLPDSKGLRTLYDFKQACPRTPVIILTGMSKDELGVEAVRHGAQNYLVKGVDGSELVHSIIYAIERNSLLVELQEQRQALAESKGEQKKLIENLFEGFWGVDQTGVTTLVNSSLCKMLGYSRDEIMGHPVTDFTDETLLESFSELFANRKKGVAEIHEFTFRRKDGTPFHALLSSAPIIDSRGNFLGAVATLLDYSEIHKAQQRQKLFTTIMSIMNRPAEWRQVLREILKEIRSFLHIKTVAIRYFSSYRDETVHEVNECLDEESFPADTRLCLWDFADSRNCEHDSICEYILCCSDEIEECRHIDGGGVWCNQLNASLSKMEFDLYGAENQMHCNVDDFASFALFPMHTGDDLIGALVFCDPRPDLFDDDLIQYLKKITDAVNLAFQRMRYEEDIIREKERARQYMDIAPVLMVALDTHGVVQMINRAGVEIVGFNQEYIIGRNWFDLAYEPATATRLCAEYAEAMHHPGDDDLPFWSGAEAGIVDSKGRKHAMRWFNRQFFDDRDNVSGALCSGLDLTRLRKTERDLQTSVDRFHKIFHHNPDMIFIAEITSGRIIEANPITVELMQYSLEELQSPKFNVSMMWRHPQDWLGILSQAVGRPVSAGQQWELKTKEGKYLQTLASFDTITIDDEPCLICVCKDLTERLAIESQLRQVQKMEAIGSLASGIAHDFNNILAVIMGYAELLHSSDNLNEEQQKDLAQLQNGCKRARDLVRQILSFSRQTEQEKKPVQLKIIVKEALKMLRASLPSTIKIEQHIKSDRYILGDATQIHQILMNLCTNSFHAMEERGGVLKVNLYDETAPPLDKSKSFADVLVLEIIDTGPGIPEHLREQIFDPYFTTKQKGKGTGLGLSIVQKIVKMHNGAIELVQSYTGGAMFRLTLPSAEPKSFQEIKRTDIDDLEITPCNILFVDDETVLLSVYSKLLESVGYSVTPAASGIEALDILSQSPDKFQVVLTDLTMPQMTGVILSQQIRARGLHMPVILTTGYSEKLKDIAIEDYGIDDIVLKPPIIRDIVIAIERCLRKSEQDE